MSTPLSLKDVLLSVTQNPKFKGFMCEDGKMWQLMDMWNVDLFARFNCEDAFCVVGMPYHINEDVQITTNTNDSVTFIVDIGIGFGAIRTSELKKFTIIMEK